MLPSKNRLNRKEFNNVFSAGKRYRAESLSLRIIRSDNGETKCVFVVSKKTAGKASMRNLLRRRGYAAVEDIARAGGIKGPFLGIFFFNRNTEGLSYDKIKYNISKLLKSAGF